MLTLRLSDEHRAATPTRWISRLAIVASVGAAFVALNANASGAAGTGPCRGIGTIIETNKTYDASLVSAITIPRQGTVRYTGRTPATGRRRAVGEIQIALPPPIGNIELGAWGHDGKLASASGKTGTYRYSFPSLLAGIRARVSGQDREPGYATCSGYVDLTIAGRSPLAIPALAITAIAIAGVSLSVRARRIR